MAKKKVYYDKSCDIDGKIKEEEEKGWKVISSEPVERIRSEFVGVKIGYVRKD